MPANEIKKQIALNGRGKRYQTILQKTDCDVCGLHIQSGCMTKMVPGAGSWSADVAIVGEALGRTEVSQGLPFVGSAGTLLNMILDRVQLPRDSVWVTNACLCRPEGNRTPRAFEVTACNARLQAELKAVKPMVVYALGGTAIRALTGKQHTIASLRGSPIWLDWLQAYMVATYHPAAILRDYMSFPDLYTDLERWGEFMQLPPGGLEPVEVNTRVLKNEKQAVEFLQKLTASKLRRHKTVACDIESDGLNFRTDRILELGLSWEPLKAAILPAEIVSPRVQRALQALFYCDKTFVWHNGLFDVRFLRYQWGVHAPIGGDTMLHHYVLDERRGHGLKTLSRQLCGAHQYDDSLKPYLTKKSTPFSEIPLDVRRPYLAFDVHFTRALNSVLWDRSDETEIKLYQDFILPAVNVVADMEYHGVRVDLKQNDILEYTLSREQYTAERKLTRIAKRAGGELENPNSPRQIAHVMYDLMGLPLYQNTRTTKVAALERFAGNNTFVDALLDFRRISKLRSTYVIGFRAHVDSDGHVHPDIQLTGAVTGRWSIRNPALQVLPRKRKDIKSQFLADKGHVFVEIDYDQLELRTAAWLSGDAVLKESLAEPLILAADVDTLDIKMADRFPEIISRVLATGEREYPPDAHTAGVANAYGIPWWTVTEDQRDAWKQIIFGALYGRGAKSIADDNSSLDSLTLKQAQEFIDRMYVSMWQLDDWQKLQIKQALTDGYLETPFGRRRRFPFISREIQHKIEKQALNFPVQSIANDINLSSLTRIHPELVKRGWGFALFPVHDSIMFTLHKKTLRKAIRFITDTMTNPPLEFRDVDWSVEVKVGRSWGETKLYTGYEK